MQDFIETLMAQMTLHEKIGQLNLVIAGNTTTGAAISHDIEAKIVAGNVGGIFGLYGAEKIRTAQHIALEKSRLRIPLIFGLDVVHGHKTIFPIPLGLSCSWDMALIEKTARIAGKEASLEGIHWVFSPMVDITRDPRWGRCAEGSGEDPYLGSRIAEAMVKGYQHHGNFAQQDAVLACVKHFALYGAAESGRDYNTTDMSRLQMHEYYLPPYKAAIDAGVASVMTSFNAVDGIPASGNKWLLTNLLRGQWGFDGLVVSDYTSVNEMTDHGLGDLQAVSALALKAGLDMDMVGEGFLTTLHQSLNQGTVTLADIDRACKSVLQAKWKLQLFDNPYRQVNETPSVENIVFSPAHRELARTAVARSCVLLKNNNCVLPLKKTATIALIGPLADDQRNMLGTWSIAGDWRSSVSILQGMREKNFSLLHSRGANIVDDPALAQKLNVFGEKVVIDPHSPVEMIAEAVATAKKSDVVVAVVGESQEMSGEAASRADITIPSCQKLLLKALAQTGKPLVIVVLSGRPLVLTEEAQYADALLAIWFGGTETGNGVADVLSGAYVPSGKLTMTFPCAVGQIPIYYNHKNTGRPYAGDFPGGTDIPSKFRSRYLDIPNEPLYPFGYGLSYTTFDYGAVTVDKTRLVGDDDVLTASITVTNTGACRAEEIVQLYITDPVASISRAVMDLKGFKKITLEPQETQKVLFAITPEHLKFYNTDLQHEWEGGDFVVRIGPHSAALASTTIKWEKKASGQRAIQRQIA